MRASGVPPVSTNQWTELHQTLGNNVFEATSELIRFGKSRVKVEVTARSVSYCRGRRNPHRRLGVKVSSSLHNVFVVTHTVTHTIILLFVFSVLLPSGKSLTIVLKKTVQPIHLEQLLQADIFKLKQLTML